MKIKLLFLYFTLFLLEINAQQTVKSYSVEAQKYYSGLLNPFNVHPKGVSPQKIVLAGSGSGLYFYEIEPAKYNLTFRSCGKCTISVCEKGKNGVKPIGELCILTVDSLPKPVLKIANKIDPKELMRSELVISPELVLGSNIPSIEITYTVISYELHGKDKEGKRINCEVIGAKSNEDMKKFFNEILGNTIVQLNVKYSRPDKTTRMAQYEFQIR